MTGLSSGMLSILLATFDPDHPVELHQGPVVGAANILGMGGAHIGIAEHAAGQVFNPAAVANRNNKNGGAWLDWDFSIDGASPGAVGTVAVDMEPAAPGTALARQTVIGTGTFAVALGRLGLGIAVNSVDYYFCLDSQASCGPATTTRYNAATVGLLGGYSFLDGAWVVALGWGTAGNTFYLPTSETRTLTGGHALAGVLFRPPNANVRIGGTVRTATTLQGTDVAAAPGATVLPTTAHLPWQIGLGVAWALGDQPLNNPPTFGEPGYRVIGPPSDWFRDARLAFDLLLEGPSPNAVSIVSWAGQSQRPAGGTLSLGARAGLESEFWPDRLRARLGTYYEPARSQGVHGRMHATGGFDLRLGRLIWNWSLGAAGDFAPRYVNTVVSLGFW